MNITTESLQKAAEKLYENIEIEFVEQGSESYWGITTLDPDECDENILIAKLYDDYTLEIPGIAASDLCLMEEGPKTPEELLESAVDLIRQDIEEYISFLEVLVNNFE